MIRMGLKSKMLEYQRMRRYICHRGEQPISKRGDERGKIKRKTHQGRKVDGSRIKSVNDGGSNSVKQIDLHAGHGTNEGDLGDGLVNEPKFDVRQCDNEEPMLGTFDGEVGYFNDNLGRENEDIENVVNNDGGLGQEEAIGVDNDGGLGQEEVVGVNNDGGL
ncbi:hypothetical protein GH714_032798 [Hevea brasiliensis]|uniref:Uncharacterized protein n=1 Tax=Hevea brasiliensis TaxID=3981 RepID=A0A6A6M2E9_HEVBR|nr:hypothetical protein GH714_032798 [Hevea brasiliensis]